MCDGYFPGRGVLRLEWLPVRTIEVRVEGG
jgi:hypothetical protein